MGTELDAQILSHKHELNQTLLILLRAEIYTITLS